MKHAYKYALCGNGMRTLRKDTGKTNKKVITKCMRSAKRARTLHISTSVCEDVILFQARPGDDLKSGQVMKSSVGPGWAGYNVLDQVGS